MEKIRKSILKAMIDHGFAVTPAWSDGTPIIPDFYSIEYSQSLVDYWIKKYPDAGYCIHLCSGLSALVCHVAGDHVARSIYRAFEEIFATKKPICMVAKTKMFRNSHLVRMVFPVTSSPVVIENKLHSDRFISSDEKINKILGIYIQDEGNVCIYGSEFLSKISKSNIRIFGTEKSVRDINEMPMVTASRFTEFSWVFSNYHSNKAGVHLHSKGVTEFASRFNKKEMVMDSLYLKDGKVSLHLLKTISGMSSRRLSAFLRKNDIVDFNVNEMSKRSSRFTKNGYLDLEQTSKLVDLLRENDEARYNFCPEVHSLFFFMCDVHGIHPVDAKAILDGKNSVNKVVVSDSSSIKTIDTSIHVEVEADEGAESDVPEDVIETEEGDPWDDISPSLSSDGEKVEPAVFSDEVDWKDEFDD